MSVAVVAALAGAAPATAQSLTSTQTTILERMTVTATRSTKSVLDVPQTITVIDQATINKRVVRDIQDLVRYEPGVSVDRQTSMTNPFGQLNSFTIRGVGANRVQVLVDGSRVQERITDGSRDFVDPWNMKAVELVRGPNSVLWGADALGGVVAFRTRDPEDLLEGSDKPWAVELKAGFDSFDNSLRKQVTGAYDFGDLQILASLGHLGASEPQAVKGDPMGGAWGCARYNYWPCNKPFPAETNAWNALFKAVYTGDEHKVTFTAEGFSRHTEVDQKFDASSVTYSDAQGNPLPNPVINYISQSYDRLLDMERSRFAVTHEWDVASEWVDSVKWTLSYSPQQRVMTTNQTRYFSPARTDTIYQLRDYGETFYEADLQLVSSFDLGWSSHTLTYGFDGDYTFTDYIGTNRTHRSDTNVTTITNNAGFSFPRVGTTRADLYLQDEIKLLDERLTLTPGVRLATYQIEPKDPSYPGLPGFKPGPVSSVTLLKKLGVSYDLNEELMVYASYGEGFKMPNAQQLLQSSTGIGATGLVQIVPNPALKPESVASYEVGVKGEFDRGYFTVAGFYADYSNFIRGLQPVPGMIGGNGQPSHYWSDNVERVQLWGIEFGGEYEVVDNVFATASIAYQKGVQRLSATSAEVPFDGATPLTAVLGVRYEIPENGLEFEVLGTFAAGPTERSDPAAFKPAGYAIFDAFAKWNPTENVEISAGIQNIFDTKYYPNTLTGYANTAQIDVANQNPLEMQTGPGRTIKIGATVKY